MANSWQVNHPVRLLDYHPENLCYKLVKDTAFTGVHLDDPAGAETPVVGVHGFYNLTDWEHNIDGRTQGALLWHTAKLSNWTATRAEFANAEPGIREEALMVGPAYSNGRWGTHFGATLTAITADNKVVLRSRAGKYAEDHLYDSLMAGTMLMSDYQDTVEPLTIDYLRKLMYDANISFDRDVVDYHPTHLAMRTADFGLWLGGWVRLALTVEQVKSVVPFDIVSTDLENSDRLPLTDWGNFDLYAMREHLEGRELLERTWLP
jgi:hypothetical protein